MDYEKKYNEALERARALRREAIEKDYVEDYVKDYETIFPELRESEDERIRKWIIDDIKRRSIGWTHSEFTGEQILAWLEKQKEQPISAEEVLARAGLKPYKDGNQWCILVGDNIQEGICGFGDTIEDALYEFLKDVLDFQKKQKEQMMKEAVEGEVCGRVYDHINVRFADGVCKFLEPKNISHIPADVSKYKVGDKVRIIIVKE